MAVPPRHCFLCTHLLPNARERETQCDSHLRTPSLTAGTGRARVSYQGRCAGHSGVPRRDACHLWAAPRGHCISFHKASRHLTTRGATPLPTTGPPRLCSRSGSQPGFPGELGRSTESSPPHTHTLGGQSPDTHACDGAPSAGRAAGRREETQRQRRPATESAHSGAAPPSVHLASPHSASLGCAQPCPLSTHPRPSAGPTAGAQGMLFFYSFIIQTLPVRT